MRNFGLLEDVADRPESEAFVEGNCLNLCVQRKFCDSLTLRIPDNLAEDVSGEAFAPLNCQQSSDAERAGLNAVVNPRIGNDEASAADSEMGGGIVDIILVEIMDMLFAHKNSETRLEDFVDFRGGEVDEGLDLKGVAFGQRVGKSGPASAGRGLVGELLADDVVDELAERFKGAFVLMETVVRLVEFIEPLPPFLALNGVGHDSVDDGVGLGEKLTVVLLRPGVGVVDDRLGVHKLLAVDDAVDVKVLSVQFAADFTVIFVF